MADVTVSLDGLVKYFESRPIHVIRATAGIDWWMSLSSPFAV